MCFSDSFLNVTTVKIYRIAARSATGAFERRNYYSSMCILEERFAALLQTRILDIANNRELIHSDLFSNHSELGQKPSSKASNTSQV